MGDYVDPEEVSPGEGVQGASTPFARAMGLAVAIANNKNAELDLERFDDDSFEPTETLIYIGGKSGLIGAEKPEAFESIEKDSNADMGDAIVTYSGDKFNPTAVVVKQTWITRCFNGMWESALADFKKVDVDGNIDPEQWEWIPQGAATPPDDVIWENGWGGTPPDIGSGITNKVTDYEIIHGGHTATLDNTLRVVDYGVCVGPISSSLFITENFSFEITCDLIRVELSFDYDGRQFQGEGLPNACATQSGQWVINGGSASGKIFEGLGIETLSTRKALFGVIGYQDVTLDMPIVDGYYDSATVHLANGIYPEGATTLEEVGLGGRSAFWIGEASYPSDELACSYGVYGNHQDGKYTDLDLKAFPLMANTLDSGFAWYDFNLIALMKNGAASEDACPTCCIGSALAIVEYTPTIFVLTTDILEGEEFAGESFGSYTATGRRF